MIALLLRLLSLILLAGFVYRYFQRGLRRSRGVPIKSPHKVLEVSESASQEEIREAYKKALSKYHPDKVAQLGEELQRVATEKTAEIIAAYKTLNKL